MPTKIEQRWITGATLLAMAAICAVLMIGCSSPPGDHRLSGVGLNAGEDSLDVEKLDTVVGPQRIALTVHPPSDHSNVATSGALARHRIIIIFQPENPFDTVGVDVTSPPGERKKRLAVTLSTPPPVTSTTGPHPIIVSIEPGQKP